MAYCNVGPIAVKFQWSLKKPDNIHQAKLNCTSILFSYTLLTALDMLIKGDYDYTVLPNSIQHT
jgi:hypothetical protein